MTETLRLDVVSDAICPWCYIGKRRLAAALPLLAAAGLELAVRWRPFQLNPDMPEEGIPRRSYRIAKFGSWARSQELDARVAAVGAAEGLEFRHELMARTPNTLAAHVLIDAAYAAGGADLQDRTVEALFAAYFTQGATSAIRRCWGRSPRPWGSMARGSPILRRGRRWRPRRSRRARRGSAACRPSCSTAISCSPGRSRRRCWRSICARRPRSWALVRAEGVEPPTPAV